jgi:methionyl-tRNA formyltransferase
MQMDEGLDTGDMLLVGRESIAAGDTTGQLHDRLAALGGRMIVDALRRLAEGQLKRTPQPADGVTYAAKIAKEEAALDFRLPADMLLRRIRAFNPFPGASAQLGNVTLKLWRAERSAHAGEPGTLLAVESGGVTVACGEGALRLTELQKPGGKRLAAAAFLQGFPLQEGQRFQLNP